MFRWQRREKKVNSKKNFMPKHGKGLGVMYASVVEKRRQEHLRKQQQAFKYYQQSGEG